MSGMWWCLVTEKANNILTRRRPLNRLSSPVTTSRNQNTINKVPSTLQAQDHSLLPLQPWWPRSHLPGQWPWARRYTPRPHSLSGSQFDPPPKPVQPGLRPRKLSPPRKPALREGWRTCTRNCHCRPRRHCRFRNGRAYSRSPHGLLTTANQVYPLNTNMALPVWPLKPPSAICAPNIFKCLLRIAEPIFAPATSERALLVWKKLISEARLYRNLGRKCLGLAAKIIVPPICWNPSMAMAMKSITGSIDMLGWIDSGLPTSNLHTLLAGTNLVSSFWATRMAKKRL